eukprot:3855533-Rhodomonas_salina.4
MMYAQSLQPHALGHEHACCTALVGKGRDPGCGCEMWSRLKRSPNATCHPLAQSRSQQTDLPSPLSQFRSLPQSLRAPRVLVSCSPTDYSPALATPLKIATPQKYSPKHRYSPTVREQSHLAPSYTPGHSH